MLPEDWGRSGLSDFDEYPVGFPHALSDPSGFLDIPSHTPAMMVMMTAGSVIGSAAWSIWTTLRGGTVVLSTGLRAVGAALESQRSTTHGEPSPHCVV